MPPVATWQRSYVTEEVRWLISKLGLVLNEGGPVARP